MLRFAANVRHIGTALLVGSALSACGSSPARPTAPSPDAILEFSGTGTGPYVVVYNRADTGRGGIEIFAANTCQEAGLTLDNITHPSDGGRALFNCREDFR